MFSTLPCVVLGFIASPLAIAAPSPYHLIINRILKLQTKWCGSGCYRAAVGSGCFPGRMHTHQRERWRDYKKKLIHTDLNNAITVGAPSVYGMDKHQRNLTKNVIFTTARGGENYKPRKGKALFGHFTIDGVLPHEWQCSGKVSILTRSDGKKTCAPTMLWTVQQWVWRRAIQIYDVMKYENCPLCSRDATAAISQSCSVPNCALL